VLGSGGIDHVFLILVFKAVSFSPQATLLPGKFASYLLDRRPDGFQGFGVCAEDKISYSLNIFVIIKAKK
jgi:hypothetical protein